MILPKPQKRFWITDKAELIPDRRVQNVRSGSRGYVRSDYNDPDSVYPCADDYVPVKMLGKKYTTYALWRIENVVKR